MKKLFIVFVTTGAIIACNSSDKKDEKKDAAASEAKTETPADDLSSNPVYQKGIELVGKSDCITCHKIEEKNIGPAWRDVANKYASMDTAVNYLANKIIAGGSGVWGQVPMAPHDTMSLDNAKALAQYVLLLKK